MKVEDLVKKLHNTVLFELRHTHYERTVELAKWYKMIITGEGQEKVIHCYKDRESEEQKKGRVKITKTLTKFACRQIIKFYKKLRRVDNVRFEIGTDNENLFSKINNWKNGDSLQDAIFDCIEYWAICDPNAIFLVDRKDVKGVETIEDVVPYSVVFDSEKVIHYQKENSELKWVIICQQEKEVHIENDRLEEKLVNHYYLFAKGVSIELIEFDKQKPDRAGEIVNIGSKQYLQVINNTGSQEIPCCFLGAYLDYDTQKEIFVSPLEDAREVFEDLINAKSEFDLTKYLHAFPQKVAFAPKCDYVHEDYGACDCGFMTGNNNEEITCPNCKGSGWDIHYSSADVMLYEFPENKDVYIPLRDTIGYVNLPEWLPQWQEKLIDKLLKRVSIAIFNMEVFNVPQFEQTATASIIEYDKSYDTLHAYAKLISKVIKKTIRLSGDFLSLSERPKPIHEFPQDYKFQSLGDLLLMLRQAKEAGSSYVVLEAIQNDILAKLYANDSIKIEMVKAEQCFKPFGDKSREELMFILTSLSTTDNNRVLWEHFDLIFKEIHIEQSEKEVKYFHLLNYEAQKKIVFDKIEAFKQRIEERRIIIPSDILNT